MTGEPIFKHWAVDTPLEQVIGEAVGAASVCWSNMKNTGLYNTERASQIVDEVVANIRLKLFFDGVPND